METLRKITHRASYRLVPPIGGKELLEDVTAAYQFARKLGAGVERRVIVGGASAGLFMASLVPHHLQPPPLALFSISGIATFHHPFFHSSTQLTPNPIPTSDVERFFNGPLIVGSAPDYDPWTFSPAMLLRSSAAKNPEYVHAERPAEIPATHKEIEIRDTLYDYFLYQNAIEGIVGDVDPGFDWALEKGQKWKAWPVTIYIQGDADVDVDKDVCVSAASKLGEKARFFMADGQPHLFEARSFLEEESPAMDVVRAAIAELKRVVSQA
ncbi:Endomembrane protein 70-like protein [Penicillium cataractarum]|uniref:Endomembrane protein 70-like protein n=1 Tax=Penicillium cataractarum TaxID=2100454 RepID=A0A9W9S182_9EURO|nr:Endomembrane protein 70-like protein [Penicillium cataractarum]KAJ5370173.1 Endomembrane protein 70-like protein [Penicillium cataractarum]